MANINSKLNIKLKLFIMVLTLFGTVSCNSVQRYYIPELKLYIKLKNNFLSESGYVYLSTTDNSWKDWIKTQKNTNTNLIVKLQEPKNIFILWNSYKEDRINENKFKIISCDKDYNKYFFLENTTGGMNELRDGLIQIVIGESLNGIWIKKSNMKNFIKIQEIQ